MATTLEGSCRCGVVHFSLGSHAPYPFQLFYWTAVGGTVQPVVNKVR